ncbi:hypothetical protein ACFL35_10505 [Candidatus Riflebacteria bacterium]
MPGIKNKQVNEEELKALSNLTFLMLRLFLETNKPLDVLKKLKKNIDELLLLCVTAFGLGGAVSIISMSMGAGGLNGILYWAGMLNPTFWVPFMGASLVLIFSSLLFGRDKGLKNSDEKNFEMIKVSYSALLIMELADGIISAEEKEYLENYISCLELSEAKKKELLNINIRDINDLSLPARLSKKDKARILAACWGLARCDGLAEEEKKVYAKLAERFNLEPKEQKNIAYKVDAQIKERHELLLVIGNTVASIVPDFTKELQEKLLIHLASLDPQADAKAAWKPISLAKMEIEDAAKAIAQKGDYAFTMVSSAYVMTKFLFINQEDKLIASKNCWTRLLKFLGLDSKGIKIGDNIDELFDTFLVQVKKESKKRKKA